MQIEDTTCLRPHGKSMAEPEPDLELLHCILFYYLESSLLPKIPGNRVKTIMYNSVWRGDRQKKLIADQGTCYI